MIVITGCPRSGTSMAMGLLHDALDHDRFHAKQWPGRKRPKAQDEKMKDMNIDGFWECRYSVRGITWHNGIDASPDKICKIVSHGVAASNPSYITKLVVMARNPRAVAKSQERLGRQMMPPDNPEGYVVHSPEMFVRVTVQLAKWMVLHEKPFIIVNYDEIVSDPDSQIPRIAEFLGEDLGLFKEHKIRGSQRRSTPQQIDHHLWEVADEIYRLLLEGDWQAILDLGKESWRKINRDNIATPCARLKEKMYYNECINCLHIPDVRRTFRDRAEKKGIDWSNAHCNFLCETNPEGVLVTAEETVGNNHWDDTLAPPPPPLSERARMALNTVGRILASVAKGRRVRARKDVIIKRRAACQSCRYRVKNRCTQCGCDIVNASRFADKQCPKGRWKE